MSDLLTITNRRALELESALRGYLSRGLPTSVARQRAQLALYSLRDVKESYDEAIKGLQEREAAARKLDEMDPDRETALAGIMTEFDILLSEAVDIPAPRAKMQENDLPKALKSNDANHVGAGLIAVTLAPEFFTLVDPDVEKAAAEELDT